MCCNNQTIEFCLPVSRKNHSYEKQEALYGVFFISIHLALCLLPWLCLHMAADVKLLQWRLLEGVCYPELLSKQLGARSH